VSGDAQTPGRFDRERMLAETIHIDGAYRPVGELTLDQVRTRAAELKEVTGQGPTARVGPVALAWRELALAMERQGVGTIAEIEPERFDEISPKLWIIPPGGGLLG
jgi:hypothetical protein